MSKTVFISYDFQDKSYKGQIKSWLEAMGSRVISTDESDLRPEGSEAVKAKIRADIRQSHLVLILVGNNTHNRPWVDFEVAFARSQGISTMWVRLANRTGAAPSEVRGLPSVEYNQCKIQELV